MYIKYLLTAFCLLGCVGTFDDASAQAAPQQKSFSVRAKESFAQTKQKVSNAASNAKANVKAGWNKAKSSQVGQTLQRGANNVKAKTNEVINQAKSSQVGQKISEVGNNAKADIKAGWNKVTNKTRR